IIMTNQSKWLISAYAVFFTGGTLVPLDYKLTPSEHWQLLKHSATKVLITEYPIWRQLANAPGRATADKVELVLVTQEFLNLLPSGAQRWEEFRTTSELVFVAPGRKAIASTVSSAGTAGRAAGCMMTHQNYREQSVALASLYPFWPGVR